VVVEPGTCVGDAVNERVVPTSNVVQLGELSQPAFGAPEPQNVLGFVVDELGSPTRRVAG
jgi:hypothetical protein